MRKRLLLAVLAVLASATTLAEEPEWAGTLERISSGVVSIRVDSTRAFDTDWNSSSQATGFVVDATKGIILTNRHVVTPGPVVAEAVFINNEEVRLKPIYRDPVHDFGFFSYNPDDLKYLEPAELPLVPGAADVGREIRVIGNDAGEQLSILAGTIARLDRKAPAYGRGKYNDFNTFYYQAASGTSGGSSGSPVIDIDGQVVALNAGGANTAASSFFLPLDRIDRALDKLRQDEPVTRGTLQTEFVRKTYDELGRLGLTAETETLVRESNPELTGMLTVEKVIAGSPAKGKLQPGDILVRVDGELITEFVPLEATLDAAVGNEVEVELERGGQRVTEHLRVSDLHAISPDRFIQFGDGILHDLSYQQARHYNRPLSGVYVANPGYLLSKAAVPRGAIITEIDGVLVDDIDDLEGRLAELADGDRVTLRFATIEDPHNSTVRSVQIDRTWFPASRCWRDDSTGIWPCEKLVDGPPPTAPEPGSTRFPSYNSERVDAVAPSLVVVNFDLPYTVSGVGDRHYYGTGLIVDTERGLVVVDRNTVPVAIGDVRITFAGSLEVDGRVEYVHPLHNLAVVSYDPESIGDTPVRAARFSPETLSSGDDIWVVGLKSDHQLIHQKSTVSSVEPITLPLSRTLRFRDANLEGIALVNAPGEVDGVLIDERGRIAAMWSSFAFQSGSDAGQFNRGVSADLIEELIDVVRSGDPVYSLEVEFNYLPLFAARKRGVDEEWLDKLEQQNPNGRRALSINRIVAGSPAADVLRTGDIVLAVDNEIVSSFREYERATQKPTVEVTVWRDDKALDFSIDTVALDGAGIDHAVMWAGALLQNPHRAMAAQRGIEPEGVYIAFFNYGSPATRYGLWAGRRIVAVDGVETPDLDAFVDVVRGKDEQESVRLKTVTWNGSVEIITLKLDNQYWPGYQIRRNNESWERSAIG